MAYLVLVRHGESEWNALGLWTGWTDVHLSLKGEKEAENTGKLIKDLNFDVAFTSQLVRAKETLTIIEHQLGYYHDIPVAHAKELDERNYGEFTGKNKWEVQKQVGEETFQKIRRGWNFPVKDGESLKDVFNRVVPYFENNILSLLKSNKNVLLVAHGNSLRALIKSLELISDQNIESLELETGEIHIYDIDSEGNVRSKVSRKL